MKDGWKTKIKRAGGEREKERETVAKTEAHIPGGRPSIPQDRSNFPLRSARLYRGERVVSRKPKRKHLLVFLLFGLSSSRSASYYPPGIFHLHSSVANSWHRSRRRYTYRYSSTRICENEKGSVVVESWKERILLASTTHRENSRSSF